MTPMLGLGKTLVKSSGFRALWTPANITTALWLDANDASTITLNGSTVGEWRDKSGNARHASQPTAVNQPEYTANGLNGKPVMTFATSDTMEFLGSHDENWSCAFVARTTTTQSGIIQYGGVNQFGSVFGEGGIWIARPVSGGGATVANNSQPTIVAATYQAIPTGVVNIWSDGSIGTPYAGTPIAVTNATSTIGGLSTNVYVMNGIIAEIVVSNGVLSTDDRQRLEGYFAWKWALEANLPIGHPYKNSPPTV